MRTAIFFINVLSNLHVGSGEINYGLVDNLIQRDPVTDLPTINSSSLKGSLRQHFEKICPNKNIDVELIFGSGPKSKERKPGLLRFFDADLLGIPVRTTGNVPYVTVSSKANLKRIQKRLEELGVKAQYLDNICNLPTTQNKPEQKVQIEDLRGNYLYATVDEEYKPIIGDRISILSDEELSSLCNNEHLPVISRNCLEDGISTNLFYEQVLPRYSRLCTVIMGPDEDQESDKQKKGSDDFKTFCEVLNNQVIQIGGNATIGYGYCKFTTFNATKQ